jgi:hypothetical protein
MQVCQERKEVEEALDLSHLLMHVTREAWLDKGIGSTFMAPISCPVIAERKEGVRRAFGRSQESRRRLHL